MQRAMDLVRAIALLLAAASALAATLSLAGAFNDDLDILTHLSPVWLAMSLAALALVAISGFGAGRITLVLAAVTIAVCAYLMGPDLVARATASRAAPEGQTLKIIQFNLWDENRDPAATARWILSEDADIVVLEETGRGAVTRLLDARYPFRTRCTDGEGCATTILSLSKSSEGGVLTWPGLGARHEGAWARFGDGADAFTVVGTHYTWPPPLAGQGRQAERFADAIERFDKESLIVAGDFNLTPWSFRLKRQDARLGLNRLTRAVFSFPAGRTPHFRLSIPFPILPIDQVYAGSAWRAVSVKRGPAEGSDHYPIVVTLTRWRPSASK